jgi:hypothetical protein
MQQVVLYNICAGISTGKTPKEQSDFKRIENDLIQTQEQLSNVCIIAPKDCPGIGQTGCFAVQCLDNRHLV